MSSTKARHWGAYCYMHLKKNFFTAYQELGYVEVVGKTAKDCMLAAIREVEVTSNYSSKGGKV